MKLVVSVVAIGMEGERESDGQGDGDQQDDQQEGFEGTMATAAADGGGLVLLLRVNERFFQVGHV